MAQLVARRHGVAEAVRSNRITPTNMRRISEELKYEIKKLRELGLSHRQIAKKLAVGQGTAVFYSRNVVFTKEQHLVLMRNNLRNSLSGLTRKQKLEASRKGGLNTSTKFKGRISKEEIVLLIQEFYKFQGRVPFKREFSHPRAARTHYGSWNKAVSAAGFVPNEVKFSKKCIANDGHVCDSQSERLIDDFLYSKGIPHERNVKYPGTKFTADFKSKEIYIEFFGLHGQLKRYEELMEEKFSYIRKNKIRFIPIFPEDLFPKSKLEIILRSLY